MNKALQELAQPDSVCYGCGPANPKGIRLKSYWAEDGQSVVATVIPDGKYTGWPDLVYGGFLALLADCHSGWAAQAYHCRAEGREPDSLPLIQCHTEQLGISYLKPTPMGVPLHLSARIEGEAGRRTRIICEIRAGEELTVVGDSVYLRAIGHEAS